MKYIITESQFKLISEIERDWRSSDYAEEYEELKKYEFCIKTTISC